MSSRETFDAVWARTGLAEVEGLAHDRTVRDVLPAGVAPSTALPHLSIREDDDELAATEPAPQLVVRRLLGEGGMGRVHLARQPLLDRDVAIKRVRPDAPRAAATSLYREARTMGSLEHPNILPVHALGADSDGQPILVMKRVTGVAWLELIGRDDHPAWNWWTGVVTQPIARHVEILIAVCRAVQFAHERGVLHLDLKPENVMLADDGGVYVLDWGVARRLDSPLPHPVAGTPCYMPPEQVDPLRPLSPATDTFLLGGCLYHALTGVPPHHGTTLQEVVAAALRSDPPEFGPDVPEALAAITLRALSADPAARFRSAADLRQELMGWIRTRGAAELARSAAEAADRMTEALAAPDPDPILVSRAFAEARFGFDRALEQWPTSPEARSGRTAVLRAMTSFEIGRDNLDHAAALLDELGGDDGLTARLDAARARVQVFKKLAHDADLSVGRLQRSALGVALAVMGAVISASVYLGLMGDPDTFGTREVLYVGIVFNTTILTLAWFGRRALFLNAINAAITWSVIIAGLLALASRTIGWASGLTVAQVFQQDLLIIAACCSVAGAFLRSVPAALFAIPVILSAGLIAAFPAHAVPLFASSVFVGTSLAAAYWYALGR